MHEDTQAQKHACRDMFENTHKRGDTDTHTGPREAKEQPMHKHMTVKLRFLATLTHCTTYSHGHSRAATKGTADLFICKSAPFYFATNWVTMGKSVAAGAEAVMTIETRRSRPSQHDRYRNPKEPTTNSDAQSSIQRPTTRPHNRLPWSRPREHAWSKSQSPR